MEFGLASFQFISLKFEQVTVFSVSLIICIIRVGTIVTAFTAVSCESVMDMYSF